MKKKLGIVAIIILIDQITKAFISRSMELGQSISVIGNFFSIRYHHNDGAAWGIFSGKVNILAIITVAACIFIIYYMYKHPKMNKYASIGFALYLAGALGNLIDRVRVGYVVDFFDFVIPIIDYDFPIFNIADMSLVLGFVAIFISILKEEKHG